MRIVGFYLTQLGTGDGLVLIVSKLVCLAKTIKCNVAVQS